MSLHLPNMLDDKQLSGKDIFIEIFNTTMAEDGSLSEKGDSPIAMINFLQSKTIISNLPLIYEFIRKEEINPHANNTAMIFFNQPSFITVARKAFYNCSRTFSHTPGINSIAKPSSLEELNNAVLEWKKKHPDFSLPSGNNVIPPLKRVPEELQTPTFDERRRKEKRTPEEKLLDLGFGNEHNI